MAKSGVEIVMERLPHGESLPLPHYASAGAAGLDLSAAIPDNEEILLEAGAQMQVPTGFVLILPPLFEAQIRPRSGLAHKYGITLVNAPGTIDSDYRGEIKVLLINLGKNAFRLRRGMRIAQMVIAPVARAEIREDKRAVAQEKTARGRGGFGSTGIDVQDAFAPDEAAEKTRGAA